MQKTDIVQAIIAVIEDELASATRSAKETADEATDDESRPENKYDTRGLEASYVASAQAYYAKDLHDALQAYRNLSSQNQKASNLIAIGSLVTTLSNNGREQFFIGPARGGLEISDITVLTPSSPLGSKLIGKTMGGKTSDAANRTIIKIE